MIDRRLADAQHEAAHVVVGLALGLPLIESVVRYDRRTRLRGWTWFKHSVSERPALALMYAAGIAWERLLGFYGAAGDAGILRGMRYTPRGTRALVVAATAILETRQAAHARVTRALLDGPVTPKTLARMMQGKRT